MVQNSLAPVDVLIASELGKANMKSPSVRAFPILTRHLRKAERIVEDFITKVRGHHSGFVTWQEMTNLAKAHGVAYVAKKPLSVSGLSMSLGTERAILIKEDESPVRQRFTFAHEIAHTLLDRETEHQVWLRTPLGHFEKAKDAIESFCDTLAGRILMPKSLLSAELNGKALSPILLMQLADKYGVSLQAFGIRAAGLYRRPCSISEWQKKGGTRQETDLHRIWFSYSSQAKRFLPAITNSHSPLGTLFGECKTYGTAMRKGEIVSEDGTPVLVNIEASMVKRKSSATMLAVIHQLEVPPKG